MSEDTSNMKDSWFFEKNFNGLSDEVFDDVIKFFDFPLEDVEPNAAEEDWDTQLKHLEQPSFDVFPVSSSGLFERSQTDNLKSGRSFSDSCNEISPLKRLAETVGPTHGKFIHSHNVSLVGKDSHRFRTYSPVSVFESSSSSSGENSWEIPVIPGKRARSKRRPISSFSPLFLLPFIPTTPGLQKSKRAAASGSDFQADLRGKVLNKGKKKQRKKDLSLLSGAEMKRFSSQETAAPRKCMHCEVTKTPQWREGALGPKTLCNACGVRYRSGRLFPEYRPAASPTFVASMHSNCHKKVIEMRNRAIQETCTGSVLTPSSDFQGNFPG